MTCRAPALLTLAIATVLSNGCAQDPNRPPVVHRPLLESTYSHDLVSPREPPPFVVEPVRPRRGYVWAHSYSRWDGQAYVTVPGQWIPEKTDYRYVDATWQRHRDGWHFKPGHWLPL